MFEISVATANCLFSSESVETSSALAMLTKVSRLITFIKVAEALQVSTDHLLRADVPEVKTIYQSELADILEGCSASEMEAILNIAREVKSSMHKQQNID